MKTGIIGLGLIGGSMAIDFRRRGFADEIYGSDANPVNANAARTIGLVDETMDVEDLVDRSDLIIIAIPVDSAEKDVVQAAERVELFKKLHDVEEPYREVIYLRVFGGLSFREIGEIHKKTENWARVTFYRGKEKLRKEVENNE